MSFSRNHFYTIAFVGAITFLLSNSGGVPQAVTLAPGESGRTCNQCHSSVGSFIPQIALEVLDADSQVVTSYIPGTQYDISVKVSGTNDPKAYGFQMTSIADVDNADMGVWSNLGERVRQITLIGKKYLVQSSPKVDGVFTTKWTAPEEDKGNISFYFAGLAVNLNGSTSGDNHVTGKLTLSPAGISSTQNMAINSTFLYPNPAKDILTISSDLKIDLLYFYNTSGQNILKVNNQNGSIDISTLPNGVYFVKSIGLDGSILSSQRIIKL